VLLEFKITGYILVELLFCINVYIIIYYTIHCHAFFIQCVSNRPFSSLIFVMCNLRAFCTSWLLNTRIECFLFLRCLGVELIMVSLPCTCQIILMNLKIIINEHSCAVDLYFITFSFIKGQSTIDF